MTVREAPLRGTSRHLAQHTRGPVTKRPAAVRRRGAGGGGDKAAAVGGLQRRSAAAAVGAGERGEEGEGEQTGRGVVGSGEGSRGGEA